MPLTLQDFVGKYTVRHGQGACGLIEVGNLLCMGTGEYGDPEPDGIRIGISIVDPNARIRTMPPESMPPVYAYLVDGTLNGSSYWLEGHPVPVILTYQISLLSTRMPDGGLYKAPSIMISVGDPQNAGVWGADDEGDH